MRGGVAKPHVGLLAVNHSCYNACILLPVQTEGMKSCYEICKNPSTINQTKPSLGGKLMVKREGLRFIIHYLLTFIHCLSFIFHFSLPIVYCPLFIIYCSLFIVYCPLFDVGSLTFLIVRVRCSLFVVPCSLFIDPF